ncbi:TetR/AcrR family transcriptional regulator [Nocardia camponoti]|uniref:TetR family transcriptional regulator n=1 Tax=Nocardia camponoti TaxID=1616106 RepID=A0A917QPH1_9NOCA|nr:TetR/AcrR family transcriptional regulator [Nocardia camponoti]GGK62116.1 TetR family transcriptional regulator [Nocardia camponoti]
MPTAQGQRPGRRYSGMDAEERTRARRSALLDAALEMFGTGGFTSATVKQICAKAALTERYFYESFRDRETCLTALYTELVGELTVATNEAISAAAPGIESAIHAGLGAFVGYLTDDPRRARVILIEVVGVSPELEELRHGVLRAFADVIGAVWAAEPDTDPDDEDSRLTAVALSGAVNNLLVDWLMTGRQQTPDVLTRVCTRLFAAAADGLRG